MPRRQQSQTTEATARIPSNRAQVAVASERAGRVIFLTAVAGLSLHNSVQPSSTAAIPPCAAPEWERKGCTLKITATSTFFRLQGRPVFRQVRYRLWGVCGLSSVYINQSTVIIYTIFKRYMVVRHMFYFEKRCLLLRLQT